MNFSTIARFFFSSFFFFFFLPFLHLFFSLQLTTDSFFWTMFTIKLKWKEEPRYASDPYHFFFPPPLFFPFSFFSCAGSILPFLLPKVERVEEWWLRKAMSGLRRAALWLHSPPPFPFPSWLPMPLLCNLIRNRRRWEKNSRLHLFEPLASLPPFFFFFFFFSSLPLSNLLLIKRRKEKGDKDIK